MAKWIEGVTSEQPIADAVALAVEDRLGVVARTLPLAALEAAHDVEHVHRLRTASRRASAALRLFRPLLPRRRARGLAEALRRIRSAAGPARDADVLLARLEAEGAGAEERALVEAARRAAQPALLELHETFRAPLLGVATVELLARRRRPDATVAVWAFPRVAEVAEAFFAADPGPGAAPDPLHRFRIRAKALRYAMELVGRAWPGALRDPCYAEVEWVQETLGALNDHHAAAQVAEAEAEAATRDGDARTAAARRDWAASERGLYEAGRAAWDEAWTAERRRRLAAALAELTG